MNKNTSLGTSISSMIQAESGKLPGGGTSNQTRILICLFPFEFARHVCYFMITLILAFIFLSATVSDLS